ncbi:MAG: diadenosine tetraphosphate hydrolase [Phycisphaerales bacterium]|nr:diadenosine tetraphosphate hydrolase [Phycisphaerales bacterium]
MSGECGVCAIHRSATARADFAWESTRWVLRHHRNPAPLNGWFLLDSKRHVGSAADFDAVEEREFAGVLARSMRAIREVLGVPRVYVVMFGEGAHHVHAHLIPRDPTIEGTAAWAVADWYRAVQVGGRLPADPAQIGQSIARVAALMQGAVIS